MRLSPSPRYRSTWERTIGHKGSREGHVKTKEQLKKFVPEQTYDEQVYILLKKEDDESLNDARNAVRSLADQHPGWTVTLM